jgi:hypothetical protein
VGYGVDSPADRGVRSGDRGVAAAMGVTMGVSQLATGASPGCPRGLVCSCDGVVGTGRKPHRDS